MEEALSQAPPEYESNIQVLPAGFSGSPPPEANRALATAGRSPGPSGAESGLSGTALLEPRVDLRPQAAASSLPSPAPASMAAAAVASKAASEVEEASRASPVTEALLSEGQKEAPLAKVEILPAQQGSVGSSGEVGAAPEEPPFSQEVLINPPVEPRIAVAAASAIIPQIGAASEASVSIIRTLSLEMLTL